MSVRAHDPSALPNLSRMQVADLPQVAEIENRVYPFPWSLGNFHDSLRSGYECWVLRLPHDVELHGYFLLMHAVDESHLLNVTVHPDWQGQGFCRLMLGKVCELAEKAGMKSVLLEVRPSNERALNLYSRYGFTRIGLRRNYYPAPGNLREDAIVMRLPL